MLHYLIACDINPSNLDNFFKTKTAWDGLLEEANVLEAAIWEARHIRDPRHREFTTMVAAEVRHQIKWAQRNPPNRPLLTMTAEGRWGWARRAHNMNMVYEIAARSNLIPLDPVPELDSLSLSDTHRSESPSLCRDRSTPSRRDSGGGPRTETSSERATDRAPPPSEAGRAQVASEEDRSPVQEDAIDSMARILHYAAGQARADPRVSTIAEELSILLQGVEPYRDTIRGAIWGWGNQQ